MVGGWPLLAKRRRAPTVREGNWARFNRRVRKKPSLTVGALWGPEGVMRGRCCNVSGVSRSARTPATQRPFAHLEKGDGPATGWWGATNECPPEIAFLVPRNFGQSNPPRNRFDWGRVKHSTSIIPRVDKQASRRDDVGSLQTGGTKAVLSPAVFAIRWSLGSCQKAKRRPAVRRFGVVRRPTPNRTGVSAWSGDRRRAEVRRPMPNRVPGLAVTTNGWDEGWVTARQHFLTIRQTRLEFARISSYLHAKCKIQ